MRIVARTFGKPLVIGALLVAAVALLLDVGYLSASRAPTLHVEEVGSDSTAFDVVATIVVGPTEALPWDTQYHAADAERIAALHPTTVVAGHKKDVTSPDSPDALTYMNHYLSDFDASLKMATTPKELRAAMWQTYPDAAVSLLVGAGAMAAFRK